MEASRYLPALSLWEPSASPRTLPSSRNHSLPSRPLCSHPAGVVAWIPPFLVPAHRCLSCCRTGLCSCGLSASPGWELPKDRAGLAALPVQAGEANPTGLALVELRVWKGCCRVTTSVVQGQWSESVGLRLQGWLWPLGCSVWFCWFGSWYNSRITPCVNSPDCRLLNAGHCVYCSLWVGVVGLPPGGAKTNLTWIP